MYESQHTKLPVLVALTFVVAVPVFGQGRALQIRVNSTQRTYACEGDGIDAVQVTGSSDILTITGNCGSLQVTGSSNRVTVDSVLSVQFTGNSNSVIYRGARTPTVSDHGTSNSILRVKDATAATRNGNTVTSGDDTTTLSVGSGSTADIVSSAMQAADAASRTAATVGGSIQGIQRKGNVLNILLSNRRTSQDCGDGANVNINGSQNDIDLRGSCGNVVLNGSGNTIHLEEVGAVQVMGHTNTLTWERGRQVAKPAIQIASGSDNVVRHVAPGRQ